MCSTWQHDVTAEMEEKSPHEIPKSTEMALEEE